MSTLILRPIADGDHIGLYFCEGVSEHWDAVNDSSPDDNSTHVGNKPLETDYTYDLYKIASILSAISQMHKINSVTVYFRIASTSNVAGYAYPKFKLAGTEYNGTEITHSTTTWTTYTQTWTTNPGTGLPWCVQDLAFFQAGIALKRSTLGYYLKCTQLYVEVDYDSSAALPISTTVIRPSGAGDVTGLRCLFGDNWDSVNDISPDDDSGYVDNNTPGSYLYDLYGLDFSPLYSCRIAGIAVTFRIAVNLSHAGYAKPVMKMSGSEYYGHEQYHANSTYTDYMQFFPAINPATSKPWTWPEVLAMQAGIALKSVEYGYPVSCTQVYVTVYRYPTAARPRSQLIGMW